MPTYPVSSLVEFSGHVDSLSDRNLGMRDKLRSARERESKISSQVNQLEKERFDYEHLCTVYQEKLRESDAVIERYRDAAERGEAEVREGRKRLEEVRSKEVHLMRAVQDLQQQVEYYREDSNKKIELQQTTAVSNTSPPV
jgi:hypothetical protein